MCMALDKLWHYGINDLYDQFAGTNRPEILLEKIELFGAEGRSRKSNFRGRILRSLSFLSNKEQNELAILLVDYANIGLKYW
eukprot:Pgem_evm1s844